QNSFHYVDKPVLSRVGQSTILDILIRENVSFFFYSSDTTRNPRPGEVNGKGTTFSSFSTTVTLNQIIFKTETSLSTQSFQGTCTGRVKRLQDVQAKNLICILDIDMQGVRSIKRTDLNPIYISIQPPSMEVLEHRLIDRKTESEESLQKRLRAARVDMEISKEQGLFDTVIVNDSLEEAHGQLKAVLLEEIQKVKKTNMSS
uniref:Guanylate kinase 1a n=1 Tax=Labrus bergylta TaxID=56723 RepID=A0A3Q3FSA4_9LABR